MKYYYKPALKELARQLRNNSTLSEVLLWNELKNGKMKGHDFHRQKPVDQYIADFFCFKLKLIIEIDGSSHNQSFKEDDNRQKRLESLGLSVLRFDDVEVKTQMNNVLKTIEYWIEDFEQQER
jgi:very-short-patch-repair endonuclease